MKTLVKLTFAALIGLLIVTTGFAAGYGTRWYYYRDLPTAEETTSFKVFWEAWHIVQTDFFGKVPDPRAMAYGAIRGALSTLNDPHTTLVEPQPRQLEKDNLKGSFGGIGALIGRDADNKITLKPMVDSPAGRAGVKEGDVLVKVDDKELAPDVSDQDVVVLIRGPIGSQVKLTVSRSGTAEPLTMTVTREKIDTPTVSWKTMDDSIGYIGISLFGERTGKELQQALNELKAKQPKGLILDLRNNPGGLLDAAVDVAGEFAGRKVILHERKKDGSEKAYTAQMGADAPNVPLVILVNKNTASAAEIVSGALRDQQHAPLIGEKTYGKGSVQLVYDLSDGSSLHVTVAQWYTPDNHQIQGQGLTPDIEAPLTDDDRAQNRDPQLDKALEYVRQHAQQPSP
jgi:carboxyl-terminal processing protease